MKALFIGGWDGNPNGTVIGCTHYWHYLTSNDVEVVNGCIEKSRFTYSAYKHFPFIFLESFWRGLRLLAKNLFQEFDFAMVNFPCFYDVPLAKLVCWLKGKPLVYNPMDPQYVTMVEDRKLARRGSLKEKIIRLYDWVPCRLADAIVVHSPMHIDLFEKTAGADRAKFLVVPQGYLREKPKPRPKKFKGFIVGYVGSFIPHQGVEYIVDAAKILQDQGAKDVQFKLLGFGQQSQEMQEKSRRLGLENVEFLGGQNIPEYLDFSANDADVLLGIFGTGLRTESNVPGKVWEALAFGKPLITAESTGTRFIGVTHGKQAWLVGKADAAALARAVLELKEKPGLRRELGQNALALFKENYTVKKLGERFLTQLKEKGLL
ncbi:MAG: glycosyltransferase [Candidatus Diapherotrites archaeon]|uniref:Glycosyltransferase n=1 Tax=Candidatus Iainarchaeum sp. TaxID=3101447 RepID=A0A8T4L7T6_9ARCH|nr:glycosyltransferase [Candidatus Diapherotrites archaeon]